jgi:isoleucyl-tRNA synthetase
MFRPVDSSVSFPKLEEAIARFWKERRIYEQGHRRTHNAPLGVLGLCG